MIIARQSADFLHQVKVHKKSRRWRDGDPSLRTGLEDGRLRPAETTAGTACVTTSRRCRRHQLSAASLIVVSNPPDSWRLRHHVARQNAARGALSHNQRHIGPQNAGLALILKAAAPR